MQTVDFIALASGTIMVVSFSYWFFSGDCWLWPTEEQFAWEAAKNEMASRKQTASVSSSSQSNSSAIENLEASNVDLTNQLDAIKLEMEAIKSNLRSFEEVRALSNDLSKQVFEMKADLYKNLAENMPNFIQYFEEFNLNLPSELAHVNSRIGYLKAVVDQIDLGLIDRLSLNVLAQEHSLKYICTFVNSSSMIIRRMILSMGQYEGYGQIITRQWVDTLMKQHVIFFDQTLLADFAKHSINSGFCI